MNTLPKPFCLVLKTNVPKLFSILNAHILYLLVLLSLNASGADTSPLPSPSLLSSPLPSPSPLINQTTNVAFTTPIPGVIQSIYTQKLAQIAQKWPPANLPVVSEDNPYWYRAIKTPDNKDMMGLLKRMWIKGSLEKVTQIYDDFQNYPSLFDGLEKVNVVSRDGDTELVYIERKSPLFFVPNIKDFVFYQSHRSQPGKVFFRHHLKQSNRLNSIDGLVVLEQIGEAVVFTGFDFYSTDWGLARTFASGKIWHDNIEGGISADLCVKYKVENPKLDHEKIKQLAKDKTRIFIDPTVYLDSLPY